MTDDEYNKKYIKHQICGDGFIQYHPSKGTSMTDCPNCEYHRKRAQRWREEAYKQAGHPLPEREWVGLIDEDMKDPKTHNFDFIYGARWAEAKLKESNKC